MKYIIGTLGVLALIILLAVLFTYLLGVLFKGSYTSNSK